MATKRRHPKRRVMRRKTAKRMSRMVKRGGGRMVKRGGLKDGEKLPGARCPKCDTYTIVADGSRINTYGNELMCKCTKCGYRCGCSDYR